MGCNTSKDNFQPAVEEAKEDSVKNGDISKAAEDGAATGESDREKDTGDDKDKAAAAATKIQAVFRGHCARKSLKEPSKSAGEQGTEGTEEPTKEQLEEEFSLDDKDLLHAATKIQATFRGHMSRKEQAASAAAKSAMNMVGSAASKIEEKASNRQLPSKLKMLIGVSERYKSSSRGQQTGMTYKMQDAVNELEGIDLADPDLHKAATKIQASFRGHRVRQEVSMHCTADESKK